MKPKRTHVLVLGALLLFLGATYGVVLNATRPDTPGQEITVRELQNGVDQGQITGVTFLNQDNRLTAERFGLPVWAPLSGNQALDAQLLGSIASDGGVRLTFDEQIPKALLRLSAQFLIPGLTLFVALALVFVLFRGYGTGAFSGFTSRARRHAGGSRSRTTFADVAGLNEAVEELREVRDFLAAPQAFEALGAKPPRGVLLTGPTGCGKTLLVRAVAGEAHVPFFPISGSQFVEMFTGVGAARVRDLFQKARKAAPSIIFVDEIDAVGRARSSFGSENAEWEAALNELLVQLDGFDNSTRVVLIAATNRPDILDPALLRKGRFDRQIVIDAPDLAARHAVFAVHARGKPLAPEIDLGALARRTAGFTGADIAAVMNEAATLAARRKLGAIGARETDEAIERVLAGPQRRSRLLDEHEKRRVAYHEAGHTLATWLDGSGREIEKVSVVARGRGLGAWTLRSDDRQLLTRSKLESDLTALLAGRVAEELVYDDPSSGAHDDLVQATMLARRMVCELGLGSALGTYIVSAPQTPDAPVAVSAEVVRDVDTDVRHLLDAAEGRARAMLRRYREHLDRLADVLVVRETLERADLVMLLQDMAASVEGPATGAQPGEMGPHVVPLPG